MCQRMYAIAMLLVVLLASVTPVVAQDDPITLVPFINETFGMQGLVPEGWSEAAPGVYVRDDITTLVLQVVPDMTMEALASLLAVQLGIDTLPAPTEVLETNSYSWTLYEMSVQEAGMNLKLDLALTEHGTSVLLVLLQTLEEDYSTLHDAVFVPVVQALEPITTAQSEENVYRDPAGRFGVPIPTNWSIEEREGYVFLYSPDELITVSLLVIETNDPEQALAEAWAIIDPDFDRVVTEINEFPAPPLERYVEYTYEMDAAAESMVQAQVRVYEGLAYVGIIDANLIEAQQRSAQINIINTGFEITAIEATDLSTVEPLPLTDDFIAEFEDYIETAMVTYQTPGVVVVIVRDGEIIYAHGFGVRNPEGDPVTPETRMMIGSTTKTMTTLLMAQMVDEGIMDWETPVIEILPTFAVADSELTPVITMENLVCACTGVPRRDIDLFFTSDDLTAETTIESLSTFEFFTDFGETFQYSNQMVASAGYITALAAGGEYGSLHDAYVNLLETRIFAPLRMDNTTFCYDEVQASGNYAVPYGLYMDFSFRPLPDELETLFSTSLAPSGGAWSTALDMANYMIMELHEGVAANGTRIVSAENLAHTWEPQIAVSATEEYGLGWFVSDYAGLQILSHAGNTNSFTSEFDLLPDHDLGVVVLTNQRLSLLNTAIVLRLLEMLFEQPRTGDDQIQLAFNLFHDQYQEYTNTSEQIAEPEIAAYTVGTFRNDALGDVTISLNSAGVLIFDAGEFQSEMWYSTASEDLPESEAIRFRLFNSPVAGINIRFEPDDNGVYQMTLGDDAYEYVFERVE